MQVVYRAENSIDANLIRGILEEAGVMAFVNGGFLQGGIGELPASDLVTVSVANVDVEQASPIVKRFVEDLANGVFEVSGETDTDDPDLLPEPV